LCTFGPALMPSLWTCRWVKIRFHGHLRSWSDPLTDNCDEAIFWLPISPCLSFSAARDLLLRYVCSREFSWTGEIEILSYVFLSLFQLSQHNSNFFCTTSSYLLLYVQCRNNCTVNNQLNQVAIESDQR
jgi:hypothetical protein